MNVRWQGTDRATTGFGKLTRLPLHRGIARPFAFAPRRCATAPAHPRTARGAFHLPADRQAASLNLGRSVPTLDPQRSLLDFQLSTLNLRPNYETHDN